MTTPLGVDGGRVVAFAPSIQRGLARVAEGRM
jgi:hypothetical protein